MKIDPLKIKTFELLYEFMDGAGGDGDSALLCDKWKEVADEFELWAKEKHPERFRRINNADCIVFQGEGIGRQEGITISTFYHAPVPHWVEGTIKTLLF